MTDWITDDNSNRASIAYWGSEEKARGLAQNADQLPKLHQLHQLHQLLVLRGLLVLLALLVLLVLLGLLALLAGERRALAHRRRPFPLGRLPVRHGRGRHDTRGLPRLPGHGRSTAALAGEAQWYAVRL